jgi:hypothetical protein
MPEPTPDALDALRTALKRQYRAALAMLRDAVDRCPDAVWADPTPTNAFWQVAYHTVYFTHLYLQPDEATFRPWAGHQGDVQHEDGIAGPADPASPLPLLPPPYGKAQVLAYLDHVDASVDGVDALDLTAAASGFSWYSMGKLEHQFVNLRHVQHHVGQLADRVRAATGEGVPWVSPKTSATGA